MIRAGIIAACLLLLAIGSTRAATVNIVTAHTCTAKVKPIRSAPGTYRVVVACTNCPVPIVTLSAPDKSGIQTMNVSCPRP